ncbi:MAG: formate--tetrahydrofolate ligase, partial [Bacteroidota bacterium]
YVATIRALKYHGGQSLKNLKEANPEAVHKGLANLDKHLENSRLFGIPAVVAINRFSSDTEEEIQVIKQHCEIKGFPVEVAEVWEKGGAGGIALAEVVAKICEQNKGVFKPLYDWSFPLEEKISTIATQIYGADKVIYSRKAGLHLKRIKRLGLDHLAICMAKTQKSLSDNPGLIGRPEGFTIHIREIEIAAGAGFLVPITGDIMRMPGLPSKPSAEFIDIDEDGNITGLF